MGRYLTVRKLDTSKKDLLKIAHLVKVELHETFYDVLDRVLRSAATGRTLLSVKLREFENSPAADGISLDQGCNGDQVKSWTAYPLCGSCAAQGFKPAPVRKTEAQSTRAAREKKRKRAAPVRRADTEEGIVCDSDKVWLHCTVP
jgi:hypothetical protein